MTSLARTIARAARGLALGSSLLLLACGGQQEPDRNEASAAQEYIAEQPGLPLEHGVWHRQNTPGEDNYGELFLAMHGHMLMGYDEWRSSQGYPPTPAWDPATPIPESAPHARRDTSDPARICHNCITPTWFTLEGGEAADPHSGAHRLADFESADQLGRSINAPGAPAWHTSVHDAIGGDMGDNSTAPLDPVFWMFHKTIDDTFRTWLELKDLPYPKGEHGLHAAE